jgi:HlyD family secretion protein
MNKKKRVLLVAGAVVVILTLLLVTRFLRHPERNGLTASGTVEATDALLAFQVPGLIDAVSAREGDKVKRGEELARLDRRETRARLAQARAQLKVTEARLSEAQRDLDRSAKLLAGGAIGQEAFDKAQLVYNVANSDRAQARAAVQVIEAVLANMVIRSSFDGVVAVRHHEPGETVPAGSPVLTVLNPDDRWVRIYIPENRIGAVHLGQKAVITTDTYPDRRYAGQVTYIASQAEFTPRNVQTTEERVKLVYAVKVRIVDDTKFELKPGIPADVRLEAEAP